MRTIPLWDNLLLNDHIAGETDFIVHFVYVLVGMLLRRKGIIISDVTKQNGRPMEAPRIDHVILARADNNPVCSWLFLYLGRVDSRDNPRCLPRRTDLEVREN